MSIRGFGGRGTCGYSGPLKNQARLASRVAAASYRLPIPNTLVFHCFLSPIVASMIGRWAMTDQARGPGENPTLTFDRTSIRKRKSKDIDAQVVAREGRPVFERYHIEKAILFGSLATGRQSAKSDVDLILVQKTSKPYFERFDGLLQDLYRAIPGRDIECFIYSPEELADISHRTFIRKALHEGIVIYEHR